MISVSDFLNRVKCDALIKKAGSQRSFASMIVALVTSMAIIPVFVISGVTLVIAPLFGWFFATLYFILYTVLGIIMIITLITYKRCSWIEHINNCNYSWFWWTHKFDLTKRMLDNNIDIEPFNDFLMSLNNKNWYIKDYRVKMPYDGNLDVSRIKYVLVFRYWEDAVQCRLVM